ncbi:MAG: conjugal transfer protein TrbI [Rhodospirillales bacterium]|nr:conjugal transfer protein TrbI [Rhodospirillales bacterium]MDE0712968.1 conjugal transfer protein TrbI [Rhodospirillales bacterium]
MSGPGASAPTAPGVGLPPDAEPELPLPGLEVTDELPPGPDGAGEAPAKGDPADFELRASPRRVTRINRRVLAVLAGAAALAVFGVFTVALDSPPREEGGAVQEVWHPGQPHPEAIERLPETYQEIAFAPVPEPVPPPVPDEAAPGLPADEDAAERKRLAKRATEALRSELFFRVQGAGPPAAGPAPDAGVPAGPEPGLIPASEPGRQARMQAFLEAAPSADIYNPHLLEEPLSPWQVMAGSVLRAALITGLNSDLPGFVVAQLTEDVFDSVTGTVLLLPRGTRLLGRYDSQVAFGQERALVVWHRLILPDGTSVVIENLPATDEAGHAGISDTVDMHGWRLARGILLSSLLGIGTELALANEGDVTRAFRESVQDGTDKAAGALVKRELDVQPTLKVRPGWPLAVLVHRDLLLRPWQNQPET